MINKIVVILLVLTLCSSMSLAANSSSQKAGYQIKAVEGQQEEWLNNGIIRLMVKSLDLKKTWSSGRRDLYANILIKNGTDKSIYVYSKEIYIANADGETVTGNYISSFKLLPGAAKTVKPRFRVKDPDFIPVKIVATYKANKKTGSFRIWLNNTEEAEADEADELMTE